MSLLAALTRRRLPTLPQPPQVQAGASTITIPNRAATYQSIPTPDATGQATHPSVFDFGSAPWNGWRYWFAFTPYAGANDDLENPCIAVSADGSTWQVPVGLTNPLEPFPGGSYYNSDTDIEYDPDTGRMWLWYRTTYGLDTRIYAKSSRDGVTWTAKAEHVTGHVRDILSPSVVRVGPGDWRMWCTGYQDGRPSTVRTATSPAGPWSAPTTISLGATTGTPWHVDVVRDPPTGAFHMLLCVRDPWSLWALTSADGVTWTAKGGGPVVRGTTGQWDAWTYRATMTLADNGLDYDIWYGGTTSALTNWWIGRTAAPRAIWTA